MKAEKDRYPYSLQLNPQIEDEWRVIQIIERAKESKIDFKALIMPLLLDLEGYRFESPLTLINELLVSIEEVKEVSENLKRAGTIQYLQASPAKPEKSDSTINEDDPLVQSLKQRAKEGRRR